MYVSCYFQPFTSCKVGAANQRSTIDLLLDMNPVSPTIPERRKSSPLKFFNFNSSPKSNCQSGVTTLPGGTQDDIWGQPIALMGQLGSVCVFYEALQPTEIKCLNSFGKLLKPFFLFFYHILVLPKEFSIF